MEKRDTAAGQAHETPLLERLGGSEGIGRWVQRFYDKIARDPLLAPLFPPDLTASREKQHAYFVEFFGGPRLYSETYGRPFLRFRHRHVRIGRPERDTWMRLVMEALAEEVDDPALRDEVARRLGPMADAMINHHPDKQDPYFFNA